MQWSTIILVCVLACQVGGRIRKQKTSRNKGRAKEEARIVGGSSTSISIHPYQVSIMARDIHICGGVIIGASTVVTAAHCVNGADVADLSVRAGSDQRTSGGTIVQVLSINKHPNFSPTTLDYDLALIYLEESLTYSDEIKAIPLWSRRIPAGRVVVTTGWGTMAEGNITLSDTLRKATFRTISLRTCRQVWGTSLDRSMFCAGRMSGGKDACQGDSGGPLTLDGSLVGIVSHGNGCGRRNFPGLYTRIPFLRPWIVANMNVVN